MSGRLSRGTAGFGLLQHELRGLLTELLHLSDDAGQAAAVGDPFLVKRGLGFGEAPSDGFAGVIAGPLPVGAVRLRRIGVASAAGGSAVGVAADDAALLDEAQVEDLAGELALAALKFLKSSR